MVSKEQLEAYEKYCEAWHEEIENTQDLEAKKRLSANTQPVIILDDKIYVPTVAGLDYYAILKSLKSENGDTKNMVQSWENQGLVSDVCTYVKIRSESLNSSRHYK